MFFESPRFPESISKGAKGGPCFSTDLVRMNSGRVKRNVNWPDPVRKYDVSHGIKTRAEFEALLAFFLAVKGMGNEFRFKDWSDCSADRSSGIVSSGRLFKRYSAGALEYERMVAKPVAGTVKLYLDVTLLDPASYLLDPATGMLSGIDDLQGVLSWEGEFDVPAAFSTDVMEAVIESSGIYSWEGILIEEVLL